jgi:hypothetical protein
MALPAVSGYLTSLFPEARVVKFDGTLFSAASAGAASGVYIPFVTSTGSVNLESFNQANSGDYTEFVYSVLDRAANYAQNTLSSDAQPTNLVISRSVDATNLTATSPSVVKNYSVTATLSVENVTYEVQDEA